VSYFCDDTIVFWYVYVSVVFLLYECLYGLCPCELTVRLSTAARFVTERRAWWEPLAPTTLAWGRSPCVPWYHIYITIHSTVRRSETPTTGEMMGPLRVWLPYGIDNFCFHVTPKELFLG
jgi:hypothetical protein